ncbi:MAG: HAMP domain-containing protein [Proteobacteria bacterium]|nr:HAMP domain-containing protein [Pseudomonadota bacterium]
MNTRSLSFRLVTWYAGVLSVVFVLLGALIVLWLQRYLEADFIDTQARRARQIAGTLLVVATRAHAEVLTSEVERLYSPEASDRFIRITAEDGQVVYLSGPPKDERFDPRQVPVAPAAAPAARTVDSAGAHLLVASARAHGADGSAFLVEVGGARTGIDAILRRVLTLLALALPLAVAVAVAGGFILVRRALTPVAQMAETAEAITHHNPGERLPVVRSGDELERLSLALNHMISRLEAALHGSKQFVADASHELRTPLTVMRGELENLAQDHHLAAETRESLGSVLEEVGRLTGIVEGLLALSRMDAGEAQAPAQRVDLGELAATTAGQMSLLAEDKDVRISCAAAPDVAVSGDPSRLKQVIVNLLDNAIKYTPVGGEVCLTVTRDAGMALLEVRDNGIGIPAEALPHVFQRFYRVDGSRSREQGGAGLGLSIVESICGAYGAQVEVSSTPGAGSTFRIRQPLAGKT